MPLSVMKNLGIQDVQPAKILLEMAEKSLKRAHGMVENVLVKVENLYLPADFVILDTGEDRDNSIILGRPFLATAKALIDAEKGELDLRLNKDHMLFKIPNLQSPSDKGGTSVQLLVFQPSLSMQSHTEPLDIKPKFGVGHPSPSTEKGGTKKKDVLKTISLKQNWNLNDLRVLNSESVGNRFRFGTFQNFEFRIGFGKKSDFSSQCCCEPSEAQKREGDYGDEVTVETLKDFHRERVKSLVDAGADLIAFETIPNKLEAQVYAELLVEEDIRIPAWFSFSCKDETHAVNGDPIQDCASIADSCSQVIAVGVNCTAPRFIVGLISSIKKGTSKPIIVYPNSGESYIAETNQWEVSEFHDTIYNYHKSLPVFNSHVHQVIATGLTTFSEQESDPVWHYFNIQLYVRDASKNWKLVQSEGNSRFSLRAIRKSDLAGLYFNQEMEGYCRFR
nr:uncharacterized protein LOC112805600 [Arachis hypogaea]